MTDLIPRRLISVHLDDGVVYEYGVEGKNQENASARALEHAAAIASTGYRHNDGEGEFTCYPPHRVQKIKISGGPVPTDHPNRVRGT